MLDPFRLSVADKIHPACDKCQGISTPQQMRIIITDPLWVNIVKDKLRKSL